MKRKFLGILLAALLAMTLIPQMVFAAGTVMISFNANGGYFTDYYGADAKNIGQVLPVEMNAGEEFSTTFTQRITDKDNYLKGYLNPISQEYIFRGWSTDGTEKNIVKNVPTYDSVLYAVWAETFTQTVNYDAIGRESVGKIGTVIQVDKGKTFAELIASDRSWLKQYVDPFIWATDPEGKNKIADIYQYTPQKDVPLYAVGIKGEKTSGDYDFIVKNNEAIIIDYLGHEENVQIPEKLGAYVVTVIGGDNPFLCPFANRSDIKTVTIPDGVKEITTSAFYQCEGLTSVRLSKNVETIGMQAFFGCTQLESIYLFSGIKSIGAAAFYGCTNLKDVFFTGTETDRSKITITEGNNDEIKNATWHYGAEPTPANPTEDGLYNIDGTWKYYENGVFTKAKGMVKCPDKNKWYYVENGVIAKKTGMVQRISDKKWFYVENGVYNNKATGVVQRVDNKNYYYVKNGKYDNTFTGVATGVTDKNTYYITKGQLKAVTDVFKDGKQWKYFVNGKFSASTGVVARSADKKWVYINKGVVTASTGMAKRLTDNKWVYVEKGVLTKKTGMVQRISDKKWFYVQNGVFNNKYTGGVKRVSDSKWFYVAKGQLNKATGLAKCTDGKYRYFKNGSFNTYTGKAKLIGTNKVYKVKNGMLVK